jgi:multidrug efflux pump subunit AcrB
VSSGQAIAIMDAVAKRELRQGMGFEWTELALQELLTGNTAVFVFILGALLVFMVLAGQYESWTLPLSIILIVPMCLLAAIVGAWERRFRQQHLHADRSGGADRPDGQERHPDRRVREAAAGSG